MCVYEWSYNTLRTSISAASGVTMKGYSAPTLCFPFSCEAVYETVISALGVTQILAQIVDHHLLGT